MRVSLLISTSWGEGFRQKALLYDFRGERSVTLPETNIHSPWKLVLGRRSGFLLGHLQDVNRCWTSFSVSSGCWMCRCLFFCFFFWEWKKPGIVRSRNLPLWYVICFLAPFRGDPIGWRFFGKKLSDWKDLRSEIYCQVEFATLLFLANPKKKSEIIV